MALNASTGGLEVDLSQSLTPASNATFNKLAVSSTGGTGDFVRQNAAGGVYSSSGITTSQSMPSNPTFPASLGAYKMQGLAGAITPVNSQQALFIISGTIIGTTTAADRGITAQMCVGSGTAPMNGATLTGTEIGASIKFSTYNTVVAQDLNAPFSMQAIATGLSPGTAYWFDLALLSVGATSTAGLSNITMTAVEL